MKFRLIILSLLALSISSWAQSQWNVTLVGQGLTDQWDWSNKLITYGAYTYVACGEAGLRIVSFANPLQPVELGSYDTQGITFDVDVQDHYAYLADVSALRIIDVIAPSGPQLVGEIALGDPGDDAAIAVVARDNYAYVVGWDYYLRIIDITNPAQPSLVSSYLLPGQGMDISVSGNYAYVADGGEGLRVLDVSDRGAPSEVGSWTISGSLCNGVLALSDRAFVAYGDAGFYEVDITNPALPAPTGSYNTPGYAQSLTPAGIYTYIADGDHGLQILNTVIPDQPTFVGSLDTPQYAEAVGIAGTYALVLDGLSMRIIDVSTPSAPVEAAVYGQSSFAEDVAVNGSYAYVADGYAGLAVVNVANPAAPFRAATLAMPEYTIGVAAAGNYAYVCAGNSGLYLVNVSVPAQPTVTGIFPVADYCENAFVQGEYIYIPDGDSLRIVHVSGQGQMVQTGATHLTGQGSDVTVANGYAYVTTGWCDQNGCYNTLQVVDVSDPFDPAVVGSLMTGNNSSIGVAVSGSYVYMAETDGLRIVDVYEPAQPATVSLYPVSVRVTDVAVSGAHAFIAVGDSGVYVLNVANPNQPARVGYYDTPSESWGVTLVGSNLFVADGSTLQILNPSAALDAPDPSVGVPSSLSLSAYPNPFNPVTEIRFDLPRASFVKLSVFDIQGRLVETLASHRFEAGTHTLPFDGSNRASGMYLVRMTSDGFSGAQRVMLLK